MKHSFGTQEAHAPINFGNAFDVGGPYNFNCQRIGQHNCCLTIEIIDFHL